MKQTVHSSLSISLISWSKRDNSILIESSFSASLLLCVYTRSALFKKNQLEAKTKILGTATGRTPSPSPCGDPCTSSIPPIAREGTKSSSAILQSDTKATHHLTASPIRPRNGKNTISRSGPYLHSQSTSSLLFSLSQKPLTARSIQSYC